MQDPLMTSSTVDFGPLFAARSRRTDPATSRLAARRYDASGARPGHVARIMAVVRERPGCTAHEIAEAAGLHITQVDRRACELERAGLISRHDVGAESLGWWARGAA